MSMLARKAIKDITTRKLRTLLVIISIATGIFGLTSINVSSGQLKHVLEETVNSATLSDITFQTSGIPPGLAESLLRVDNVVDVQERSVYFLRWTTPRVRHRLLVVGIPNFLQVRIDKFDLIKGQFPLESHQILLEQSDTTLDSVLIGDQITLEVPHGKFVNPEQFTVSGFVRTPAFVAANFIGFGLAYVPEAVVLNLLKTSVSNQILFKLADFTQRSETADRLRAMLIQKGVRILVMTLGHPDIDAERQGFEGVFVLMRVLSFIALILSGFLIASSVSTLIADQVRQIGTLKVIGATQGRIILSYLLTVLFYGILGSLLGLVLGMLGGVGLLTAIGTLLNLDIGVLEAPPRSIVVGLLVGIGIAELAALLPVVLGTRITVQEAISTYGITTGKGRLQISRWLNVLLFIPQSLLYPLRNIFRKKARSILTLSALAIAGAAFVAVQSINVSFDDALTKIFVVYQGDVFISLGYPIDHQKLFSIIPSTRQINAIEPFALTTAIIHESNVQITGLQPNSTIYHKTLIAGRWFTGAENNLSLQRSQNARGHQGLLSTADGVVVVSRHLADTLHLHLDETITLKGEARTARWRIIGIAVDNTTSLGVVGIGLAPINQVRQFTGLPLNQDTTIFVRATQRNSGAVLQLADLLDRSLSANNIYPTITTKPQLIDRTRKQWQVVRVLLYTVTILIALAGGIGLFNTLWMSVSERRREIGVLRAMGASTSLVAGVFWLEGICLGGIAWWFGIVLGYPIAWGFILLLNRVLVEMTFHFPTTALFSMLGFILVVAALSSIGPALAAGRMSIAGILRYE